MYYTAEIKYGSTLKREDWEKTRATTIDNAKRAARKRRRFLYSTLYVGERLGTGEPYIVSMRVREPDRVHPRGWT